MSASDVLLNVVPALRFAGFNMPWRTRKLGEVATVKHGFAFKGEYFTSEGKYIVLTPGNFDPLSGFRYQGEKEKFYANTDFPRDYVLKCGDLLTVMTEQAVGLIGCALIVPEDEKFLHNQRLGLFQFVDDTEKRFIYYYLRTNAMQVAMSNTAAGSKVRHTSPKRIEKLELRVPPLPEQRKIADFLTAVDERIAQLSQKKALLEDYKKGVMQQLFTQALRFQDDHGNDFPDWEEKTLGEIGTITTGKTPSTSDDAAWIGKTMFVTPSDIGEDTKFQYETSRHVTGDKLRLLPKNSLMFTCIASIGKMSIATAPCITNQQINSITVGQDFFFEYVYYALRFLTPQIKATQANTTLPIINKTEFSKFVLPVPALPEQKRIANFLAALDRKIEVVAAQIAHTQTWKKGLLQQMFV